MQRIFQRSTFRFLLVCQIAFAASSFSDSIRCEPPESDIFCFPPSPGRLLVDTLSKTRYTLSIAAIRKCSKRNQGMTRPVQEKKRWSKQNKHYMKN